MHVAIGKPFFFFFRGNGGLLIQLCFGCCGFCTVCSFVSCFLIYYTFLPTYKNMDTEKKEKRIESPLVRYDKFDQPVCRVCDVVLQSESLWDAHQVSRKHRETSHRLCAAIWEVLDGLVTTASLMITIGALMQDIYIINLGLKWLVARACSMFVFLTVYPKLDRGIAEMKSGKESEHSGEKGDTNEEKESLPKRLQAAAVSALTFSVGAMVPLLVAFFIREYEVWLTVVVTAVGFALVVFGWLMAVLAKGPVLMYVVMFLVGGWMVIAITFVLMKLIGSSRFMSSLDM